MGARGEGREMQGGMERCREAKRYRAMQISEGHRETQIDLLCREVQRGAQRVR